MHNRLFGGNGSSMGFTNMIELGPGWVLFVASQSDPAPGREAALRPQPRAWSSGSGWQPAIRVRSTLPITQAGDTIGIHVWYDSK